MAQIKPVTDETQIDILCMACDDPSVNFHPMRAQRRACGDEDIVIDMKYCGMCHTDIGIAANRKILGNAAVYPCVPGHELAGIVSQVGSKVKKFTIGEQVGVGPWVDSCLSCNECMAGREQSCKKGGTLTYQGKDKHKRASFDGCNCGDAPVQRTMGGYTTKMVVHEHFAIKIPASYPIEAAGPIMCAGVTVYEPMKEYGLQAGMKLAVVGLGGLGLTAIKIGNALGADVSAVSRGTKKEPMAREAGAKGFISSTDSASMSKKKQSLDMIIDTIPMSHNPKAYHQLLKSSGKYIFLGLTEQFFGTYMASKMCCFGSGSYRISNTGGIANTQEVIDLCAKHKIVPNTKIISVSDINKAVTALDGGNDDGIRYVIDIGTLTEASFESCKHQGAPTLSDVEKPPNKCMACLFCCKISCPYRCCCGTCIWCCCG